MAISFRVILVCSLLACTAAPVTLSGLVVSPDAPSIAVGATLQLTATGVFSDGSNHDLTSVVGWSSSKPGYATISSTGLVTGIDAGVTQIDASTLTTPGPDAGSPLSGGVALTVTTSP